jgi:hypothetical protein
MLLCGNSKIKPQLKEKNSKKDKTLQYKGGELIPLNKDGRHSLGSLDKVVCRKKHYYSAPTDFDISHTRMCSKFENNSELTGKNAIFGILFRERLRGLAEETFLVAGFSGMYGSLET